MIIKEIRPKTILSLSKVYKNVYFSRERYQTALNALKNIDYSDGVEYAINILSGKHGLMCQYDNTLNFETIWSSVFDMTNNKIYRAEGNPLRLNSSRIKDCK